LAGFLKLGINLNILFNIVYIDINKPIVDPFNSYWLFIRILIIIRSVCTH
jgi:hypothetical protein